MSKELPYFKFFPSEWITGDVTLCSMEAQGIFTNILGFYWNKNCSMSLANAKQRFSKNVAGFNQLLEMNVIKVDKDENIIINFLDEQMNEFIDVSEKRSIAGKKGGLAKAKQVPKFAKAKRSNKDKEIDKDNIKRREDKDLKKHLFLNSEYFDLQKFIIEIKSNDKYLPFDCEYYHECLINWSAEGNMKKDWIATARNWMLRDVKDGKAKLEKKYQQKFKQDGKQSYNDKINEYLSRERNY